MTVSTGACVQGTVQSHTGDFKQQRKRIFFLTVSGPWMDCERTVGWPWVDRGWTVSGMWVDRGLTWVNRGRIVGGLCVDRGLTVGWPWADRGWIVGGLWMDRWRNVGEPWVDRGWTVGLPWFDRRLTVGGSWADRGWTVGGPWMDCGWIVGGLWMDRRRNVGGPWASYVMKVKKSDKSTPCIISKYEKSKLSYKLISSSYKSFVYSNNASSCQPKLELCTKLYISIIFLWRCGPTRAMASSFLLFLDHTQRHTTVGRTSLDEWSGRRWDLYLTTHNTQHREKSMPPTGFETTIPVSERQ